MILVTPDSAVSSTSDVRLANFLALSYDVTIHKVNDEFVLTMPDLALTVRGTNLEALYQEIEQKKVTYFQAMLDTGHEQDIRRPSHQHRKTPLLRAIAPFTLKVAIAVVGVVFGVLALGSAAEVKLKDLRVAARNVGKEIPRGLEEGMLKLKAMPPEKQEKVLASVRAYLHSVSPIIREIQSSLHTPPPSPSETDGK